MFWKVYVGRGVGGILYFASVFFSFVTRRNGRDTGGRCAGVDLFPRIVFILAGWATKGFYDR